MDLSEGKHGLSGSSDGQRGSVAAWRRRWTESKK